MIKQIEKIRSMTSNPVDIFNRTVKEKYMERNPILTVHPLYRRDLCIQEYKRIAVTRIRLSSHYLKVEMGRWSRISREQWLFSFGEIQDERHLLLGSPFTQGLREKNEIIYSTVPDLMQLNTEKLSTFVYNVLRLYGVFILS